MVQDRISTKIKIIIYNIKYEKSGKLYSDKYLSYL